MTWLPFQKSQSCPCKSCYLGYRASTFSLSLHKRIFVMCRKTMNFKALGDQSTVAQLAERAPQDQKVLSLNPALDPMRRVSKYNPY